MFDKFVAKNFKLRNSDGNHSKSHFEAKKVIVRIKKPKARDQYPIRNLYDQISKQKIVFTKIVILVTALSFINVRWKF